MLKVLSFLLAVIVIMNTNAHGPTHDLCRSEGGEPTVPAGRSGRIRYRIKRSEILGSQACTLHLTNLNFGNASKSEICITGVQQDSDCKDIMINNQTYCLNNTGARSFLNTTSGSLMFKLMNRGAESFILHYMRGKLH